MVEEGEALLASFSGLDGGVSTPGGGVRILHEGAATSKAFLLRLLRFLLLFQ